jgi:hypothetical protein
VSKFGERFGNEKLPNRVENDFHPCERKVQLFDSAEKSKGENGSPLSLCETNKASDLGRSPAALVRGKWEGESAPSDFLPLFLLV